MRFNLMAPLGAALFLAALGVLPASAQSIPSPFAFIEGRQEAGPFVGLMSAGTGRFGYGPRGGLAYGARWGIELSGPVSFEGAAGLLDGTRDIINPARVQGDQKIGEGDVLLSTFDARFKFGLTGDRTWHGLSPFILAGGGITFDLAGAPAAEVDLEAADRFDFGTSFLGTTGVGARWFFSDRFALRTDALFSLWKLRTPPGFSDPARGFEGVAESEWASGLSILMSLLFRW